MKKFAVIGKDVSRSSSPEMHSFIATRLNKEIDYSARSIAELDFNGNISTVLNGYDGLNVTIPYKLSIIPYLDAVVGDAQVFGAVNTVKAVKDGSGVKFYGYNTDGEGFILALQNSDVQIKGKTFLLLGAGGAGRSVAKKLLDYGAAVYVYDKNEKNTADVIAEFDGLKAFQIGKDLNFYCIINATGVGMHKTEGKSPVDETLISKCEVAMDLIYVPKKSRFLEIAESLGKKIINGMAMLFYQAYYSECIFFNLQADANTAKIIFEEYLKEV